MTAANYYDSLIALQKSQISPKYHKRFLERISDEEGSPSISDQVKALESEYLDITGVAPKVDQNSESTLDPEMKEFLQEKFPQNQNPEAE
ncbi:hypothetical protein ACFLTA_02475 [Bacteroidota bacterium]